MECSAAPINTWWTTRGGSPSRPASGRCSPGSRTSASWLPSSDAADVRAWTFIRSRGGSASRRRSPPRGASTDSWRRSRRTTRALHRPAARPPRAGARLVDATVGLGGHAAAPLAAAPGARLLGLDRDPAALARAAEQLPGERVVLRQARFSQLSAVLAELEWDGADAVLLDLGVSSLQLDDPARGFSFQADGPLDMRMDPGSGPRAAEIVNQWSEREIARALAELGEEPRARALARAIVRTRPLATTGELARVVAGVLGRGRPGLHPATRTFQAIRIAVNDELAGLERFLADGWRILRPEGRLAVLADHSLEDRRGAGGL